MAASRNRNQRRVCGGLIQSTGFNRACKRLTQLSVLHVQKTDTIEMVDEQIVWLGNDTGLRWREHYNNLTDFWETHLGK